MALFGNGDPEKLFLFVQNFKIILEDSGTLAADVKLQYLCMISIVEVPHQFDTLCDQVGSTTTTQLNQLILG